MTDPTPEQALPEPLDTGARAQRHPRCELCGGQQVGNLGVGGQVGIHPNGRVQWGPPLSNLHAVLCLQCGYTKLFAAQLSKVQSEAKNHPERFTW